MSQGNQRFNDGEDEDTPYVMVAMRALWVIVAAGAIAIMLCAKDNENKATHKHINTVKTNN